VRWCVYAQPQPPHLPQAFLFLCIQSPTILATHAFCFCLSCSLSWPQVLLLVFYKPSPTSAAASPCCVWLSGSSYWPQVLLFWFIHPAHIFVRRCFFVFVCLKQHQVCRTCVLCVDRMLLAAGAFFVFFGKPRLMDILLSLICISRLRGHEWI